MPWKGERDPYKIWLSEVILQQTRVEQGRNYYNNFVNTFPDVHKLAGAAETKVFKLWEGLGYYTRCRNLVFSAKYISKELGGKFPDTYEGIKALKGVGPYTAAAISSFAYNLPHAVVDGNVFRVLARVFGVNKNTDSADGKKYFNSLAEEVLDKKSPGIYNQAIMDFGAVICKPAAPLCADCIFKKYCYAFRNNKVSVLPAKEKRISIKKRWFYYLVLEYKNQIAIRQRNKKDIWQGLYEFLLIEEKTDTEMEKTLKIAGKNDWISKKDEISSVSPVYKQQLSHQLITGQFIKVKMAKKIAGEFFWVDKHELGKYAFPQLLNQYLKNT